MAYTFDEYEASLGRPLALPPDDDLTLEEIADLRDLGPQTYQARVLQLFQHGQATPAQWTALAAAGLACSESGDGALVTVVARAVLAGLPTHGGVA